MWEYIKTEMMKRPNQTVWEGDACMTYEQIVVYAELFANKIKGEKCCAILCGSEMTGAIAILSCFAAGVTAVPLSLRYGVNHCQKIIETIGPSAIITDSNGMLQVMYVSRPKYSEPTYHPAVIMCTSGTTGMPKGVMLSERNLFTNIRDITDYFKVSEKDNILISRPIYHSAVLTGEWLTSLVKGLKIRFYSDEFNPQKILDLIINNNITVFCGTPTMLGIMARFKKQKCCPLTSICISGECLDKNTAELILGNFPNVNIYYVYGLTEAGPRVSYLPPNMFRGYYDCVGYPLKSVSIRLIKKDGTYAKPGEEGILWIKGDNVMLGYYNNDALTKNIIKNGWLCTGDIGTVDDRLMLRIKGRNDDLIIRAGMNIYPQEIENALKTDKRVKEVVVYGEKDKIGIVHIKMKIVGNFSSVSEVKTLCKNKLPAFQIPTFIELVDTLPKNGSGKIIRR